MLPIVDTAGTNPGGFNALNSPSPLKGLQFWSEVNTPWLAEAVKRGDPIYMATSPSGNLIGKTDIGVKYITGFGREYAYLWRLGYRYDPATGMMIPPVK